MAASKTLGLTSADSHHYVLYECIYRRGSHNAVNVLLLLRTRCSVYVIDVLHPCLTVDPAMQAMQIGAYLQRAFCFHHSSAPQQQQQLQQHKVLSIGCSTIDASSSPLVLTHKNRALSVCPSVCLLYVICRSTTNDARDRGQDDSSVED